MPTWIASVVMILICSFIILQITRTIPEWKERTGRSVFHLHVAQICAGLGALAGVALLAADLMGELPSWI